MNKPVEDKKISAQNTTGRISKHTAIGNISKVSNWERKLALALMKERGEQADQFVPLSFPTSYRETFSIRQAINDINKIEKILGAEDVALDLYRPRGVGKLSVRFRLFHAGAPLPLSDVLPMLENMGLKVIEEIPYAIRCQEGQAVWMHDFGMVARNGMGIDLVSIKDTFEETFIKVWQGKCENDGLNSLVAFGALSWEQVALLRAYSKFLGQTTIPFSDTYVAQTLLKHAKLVGEVISLFEVRFDPHQKTKKSYVSGLRARIERALNRISNIDEDRILQSYVNLVDATVRTNFFQTLENGNRKNYISLKFDSIRITDLPLPRPKYEIFVYSPQMEGIHLRGGNVARGGIRWSDRAEDYRSEILGLMKAQMTKNAVIVPVGAKGGFILKQPPKDSGQEGLRAEAIACYKLLIRGILDITDNFKAGKVVRPNDVVCLDDEDPYLVVAADKGTASFSDIANSVAREYGFWLDDAFASGGSAGYDHKKMGITARGAWESVKRHFREIGINTQKEEFVVVGIGDMSGDVFGNGMLLSKKIKLVAAFNHNHIFIDPKPDPASSWKERKRLFRKKNSKWTDYNRDLISKGGGIFDRAEKSIALTPQIKKLLDLSDKNSINPNELIGRILICRTDLMWFAGIGTYVKSQRETHSEVGDRRNDPVRIDGKDLRCKVIGEGANMGITQLGRIEYSLNNGRLNSDFIDNSAGVASSDQEVNVKILLRKFVEDETLALDDRDILLSQMTKDVAEHVLMDNYRQSMAVTHVQAAGTGFLSHAAQFIRVLERAGKLNRQVEFLPEEEEFEERRRKRLGLTRPEISILLAYAKITLYDDLLHTDLPDDPWLVRDIGLYFPPKLTKLYEPYLGGHPLRREISATYITNSLVNRMGPTFINELQTDTGASSQLIVRAYLIARRVFGLRQYWAAIEGLDNLVSADVQTELHFEVSELAKRGTKWFLKNEKDCADVAKTVDVFEPGVHTLCQSIGNYLSEDAVQSVENVVSFYCSNKVPAELARSVAYLPYLFSGCDIVRTVRANNFSIEDTATIYFDIGAHYGFDLLRQKAENILSENDWQAMAITAIVDELYEYQAKLANRIINFGATDRPIYGFLEEWEAPRKQYVTRVSNTLAKLRASDSTDVIMLSVATRQLGWLSEF